MWLGRQSLNVLTPSVGRAVRPSEQIVKNVMRDAASRVFVFSQLRKHETMTLMFHKRKYWKSGTGTGNEFRVMHRFLKRPAQELDTILHWVRRKFVEYVIALTWCITIWINFRASPPKLSA